MIGKIFSFNSFNNINEDKSFDINIEENIIVIKDNAIFLSKHSLLLDIYSNNKHLVHKLYENSL